MQEKDCSFCGSASSLEVRCTGKPVSGWGGLVAVMRYLENLGVGQVLAQVLPDGRTSPNQIPVLDMVLGSSPVLTGACRFAHVERLRTDEVVQAILGVKRMPSAMSLTRYPVSQKIRVKRLSPKESREIWQLCGCAQAHRI